MNKQFNAKTGSRGITWCDLTINPIRGCQHGCGWDMPGEGEPALCYAKEAAERLATRAYSRGFSAHYWQPRELARPETVKTPSLTFVGSMADIFAQYVPTEQIWAVLAMMRKAWWHTFQILTKNAPRLLQFADRIPGNCWVGVSMPPDIWKGRRLSQHQKERMLSRAVDVLDALDVPVRWMSFEPLSWDVAPLVARFRRPLEWAVIGAASKGPKKIQPDAADLFSLVHLLEAQGTELFYKDNLAPSIPAGQWREDFPVIAGASCPAVRARQFLALKHGWPLNRNLPVPKAVPADLETPSAISRNLFTAVSPM